MSVVNVSIDLQEPHPAQWKILNGAKRFNHLRCGRRFGKTALIAELASIAIEGKFVGVWFPTYKDLDPVWEELKKTFSPIIQSKNEVLKNIKLFGGGLIDFWSMENPDSGQGRKYHRAIIDEAAKAPKLYSAWENTIRPTLTDYVGDGFILSRPKGKNNPFYQLEEKHKKFDNWAFFHFDSYANCKDVGGHLERSEIDEAKSQLDDINFRQEYGAEYVDANDRPFLYKFKEALHVVDSYIPNKHLPIMCVFDFNKDPMTCLIGQQVDLFTAYAFAEINLPEGSTPEVCDQIIVDYVAYLGNIQVSGDATGRNRSALIVGNLNHYRIIKQKLGLNDDDIKVPKQNPAISDSRVLCNSVLQNAKMYITKNCERTIRDLNSAYVDETGELVKTQLAGLHHFDTFRYMVHAFYPDFVRHPEKYK